MREKLFKCGFILQRKEKNEGRARMDEKRKRQSERYRQSEKKREICMQREGKVK